MKKRFLFLIGIAMTLFACQNEVKTNATIKLSDKAARLYGGISTCYEEIEDLWKNAPGVINNSKYLELVNARDYNGVADYLMANITTKDPDKKIRALTAINNLKHLGNQYKPFIENINDEQRQAIEFMSAMGGIGRLPNAKYNKFTEQYNRNLAGLIGYTENGQPKIAKSIGVNIRQLNADKVLKQLQNYGIGSFQEAGIQVKKEDNHTVYVVDKNSPYLRILAAYCEDEVPYYLYDDNGVRKNSDLVSEREKDRARNKFKWNNPWQWVKNIPRVGLRAAQTFAGLEPSEVLRGMSIQGANELENLSRMATDVVGANRAGYVVREAQSIMNDTFKNNPNLSGDFVIKVAPKSGYNQLQNWEMVASGERTLEEALKYDKEYDETQHLLHNRKRT